MHCLPGWDTGGGNPRVVVADHGNSVDSFREADLLTAAPGLKRSDW